MFLAAIAIVVTVFAAAARLAGGKTALNDQGDCCCGGGVGCDCGTVTAMCMTLDRAVYTPDVGNPCSPIDINPTGLASGWDAGLLPREGNFASGTFGTAHISFTAVLNCTTGNVVIFRVGVQITVDDCPDANVDPGGFGLIIFWIVGDCHFAPMVGTYTTPAGGWTFYWTLSLGTCPP